MRRILLAVVVLLVAPLRAGGEDDLVDPFEDRADFVVQNVIDVCVLAGLEARGLAPAPRAADGVFLRRVHLDVLGTLPDEEAVHRFLGSRHPEKREREVDAVLAQDGWADMLALHWGDVLRIKAEYPINLWPNGVQAYDRWLRDQLRTNRPFDQVVRELLTASGSAYRVPPVNFWRAVQGRTPNDLAAAVALTFLGERIERWPAERRRGFAVLFSRVRYKPTREWKEEVVIDDPSPSGPLSAILPDGTPVEVPAGEDPRRVFADWLLGPGAPRLAASVANRTWAWLLGRGVVEEPDDLGEHNPPANPALLACLERQLVGSGWDMKALVRLILTSRTYQASPVPRSDDPRAEALFAHHPVWPVEAEVLADLLLRLGGPEEEYMSMIPEPYTFLPPGQRSVELADGSITSSFLELFGRPARDTGLMGERSRTPTAAQRLFLLNASEVRQRIQQGGWMREGLRAMRGRPEAFVRWAYRGLLTREPTPAELDALRAHATRVSGPQAAQDLVWALLNTKEFLYHH